MKLSIIIPVYNEKGTILEILKRIESTRLGEIKKEVIIVDDFSTDGTREILKNLESTNKYKIIYHNINRGKGFAVRSGLKHVGDGIVIIQDADLEYDPSNYEDLIKPILSNQTDVVYGSRFLDAKYTNYKKMYLHYVGNMLLTYLTNLLYNTRITDMETCFKVFKKDVIVNLNLKSKRFDLEPELTAKISRQGYKIHEVPIIYKPRGFSEGKKITWVEGVRAVYYLLKYRFFD